MKHKLSRTVIRTKAAVQLLDILQRYLDGRPIDENERLIFEEIPLTEFALASHVAAPKTALHKLLYELAYYDLYVMAYDDLQFDSELLPEIKDFLSFIFSEMRISAPAEFLTDDPEKFRIARNMYRDLFKDGIYVIVDDAFALAWQMRRLLTEFNKLLAARIRNLRHIEDSRLAADGRLPRLDYYPSWLEQVLHIRDGCICQSCGNPIAAFLGSTDRPHIDHIVALVNGGGNDPTNLRLLCAACNLKKGANHEVPENQFSWPNANP